MEMEYISALKLQMFLFKTITDGMLITNCSKFWNQ